MILNEILERNAVKYPNIPALTMRMGYRTVNLNYKQVYELSCRIALFLQEQGVGRGDKVIIFAPNSPYWVCVFWGLLLNGSVAVPVNVQSTQQMIDKIAAQTEAKLIFKGRYLKYQSSIPALIIDFIDELVEPFSAQDFKKIEIAQDDLVEILYTSGTTGDPKGVLLTHKNIVSNVELIARAVCFKHGTVKLLSILPLTHIIEQTIGLMFAFYYAAHIVYAHSYAAILDLLAEHKIDKMAAVPEFLKVFMQRIKASAQNRGKLKLFNNMMKVSCWLNNKYLSRLLFYGVLKKLGGKLDVVACGGAPLDPELEREWNSLGVFLIQGYGLTETSPIVCLNTFKEHRMGSVGKVLRGVQVKLEEDGEILVKGPNVFQGYFKDTEKTQQAFTADGWFKTGDMGAFDKDGFMFLKGRKKYMILSSGGQNVFPEDIEFELNKISGVRDSCVLGFERQSGGVEICAVLLLDVGVGDPEKIVELANSNLASYQHINSWLIWQSDDFPRSATRKVKRDDVKKILLAQRQGQQLQDKVLNKSRIVQVLSQVSGVEIEKINSDTKIVRDLSMDSLMRVELVMRLELELNVSVDETEINGNTTVKQLEELVEKSLGIKKSVGLKRWPRSMWARAFRFIGHPVAYLIGRSFMKLEVKGLENLKGLNFPVIFMPNHLGYHDSIAVLMALPGKIKRNLAFAAARDVLYEKYAVFSNLVELFFNTYPLARLEDESIKLGLENTGKLLDQGYSIVVFPEGKISLDGNFQPLKLGAGFMAVEMGVAVVPIKIEGTNKIAAYGKVMPQSRGVVKVTFGKPITFKKSDSYESAKDQIETVMRGM